MRLLLAGLAWFVMVLGVLGGLIAIQGAIHFQTGGAGGYNFAVGSASINGVFRMAESIAVGLGLLFVLNVDKRLKSMSGSKGSA